MKKRIPRPARCPTMVALAISPEVETTELMAVLLFRNGTADKGQFNILADCRDLLMLAAHEKRDAGVQAVCELAGVALLNIKDRYLEKERMGATGEELKALQALVDISRDFFSARRIWRSTRHAGSSAKGKQHEQAHQAPHLDRPAERPPSISKITEQWPGVTVRRHELK